MGRAVEFDSDAVIDAALSVFWEQGVHRTSVEDLLLASNLSRSSLYNTFGGKNALFEQAALRYIDQQAACLQQILDNPSLEHALQKLFESAVHDNFDGRGCLLINSAGASASGNAPEKPLLQLGFERMFSVVAERIRIAQNAKQVSLEIDPIAAATLICASFSGLGIFQKAGMPKKDLKKAADLAVKTLMQSLL